MVKAEIYRMIELAAHPPATAGGADKKEARQVTSLFCFAINCVLRLDRDAAGFDWDLWEVISTNELARARLDHVVEENLADGVFAWSTVVENGKEGGVKLIVENRISCLPD